MTALARTLQAALIASALLSPLPCQEYVRWLQDLGDEQKSEPAERALAAMGPKAVRPLSEQIEKWDTSTKRERARCLALLRVVNLLGEDAATLSPNLKQRGLEDGCPLVPQVADALATLEPYANDQAWHELFHQSISSTGAKKEQAMRAFIRMASRQRVGNRDTFEALKKELAKDRFGAREVVAEEMAKLGNKDAIDLLHQRLLDRDKQPEGGNQLRHNGWVVPITDEFGLRAGNALITLAPSDPRAAIGYANRALYHPHRSTRLDALRQMAQLGPAAKDAIPELMRIALRDDGAMALEALKLLGMADKGVGKHLLAIDKLANANSGPASRVAKGLAARLRAMGCEPETIDVVAQELAAELAKLDKALDRVLDEASDESSDADVVEQVATTKGMWPQLSERFRKAGTKTPDTVFDLIARVGWLRSEQERTDMQQCLVDLSGDHWKAEMMSSSSRGQSHSTIHYVTHARLGVDPASPPDELASLLKDKNPFVRQVAGERLRDHADRWAKDTTEHDAVRNALVEAATTGHPKKFSLQPGPFNQNSHDKQNSRRVQAVAAEALASYRVPNAKAAKLLRAVAKSKDEALVVKAIQNWTLSGPANKAVAATLNDLATDKREPIAQAAKAALAQLEAK